MILIKNAKTLEGVRKSFVVDDDGIRETDKGDKTGRVIDAKGKIAMKGLLNSHTHSPMTLFRGHGEDLPLDKWLKEKVFPLESKLKSKHAYWGAMASCMEMIKSGTVSFIDMYFFMDEVARATRESGLNSILTPVVFDFPTPESTKPIKKAKEFIKKWKNEDRIRPGIGSHSIYTCSKETLQKTKDISDRYSVFNHIHLSETRKEVYDSLRDNGKRPAEYLDDIEFLGEKTFAAHCGWLSLSEIKLLSRRQVKIAHCPVSNMKLSTGIAPLPEILENGIKTYLGTDSAVSNNTLDIFDEARVCGLIHKVNRWDAGLMAVQRLYSLMKDDLFENSLILVKPQPPYKNYKPNMIYGKRKVDTVINNGKILMEGSKLKTLDEGKINQKIDELYENL